MSQRKVEKTVTQVWRQTIKTCDLCGLQTEPGCDWPSKGFHTLNETEIECKVGSVWPSGDDDRTLYRLDVCPTCFVDKFIPAVEKALGVKFTTGDVE